MKNINYSKKTAIIKAISQKYDRCSTLQMAAMIDIIFLLLIFFLVAAKWCNPEYQLPFDLPGFASAAGLPPLEPMPVTLEPCDDGFWVQIAAAPPIKVSDQNPAHDLALVLEKIQQTLISQKRNASDPIELSCSKKLKYKHLARFYNLLYGSQITNIILLPSRSAGEQK
ncbi:MAG: biopolymer transporter ExbD [Planctomycetes bacterium]|nr:biopolymer transporter ExbD [Planctomycetota bacterium]MBL7106710.1 biopolymer transporter ExbD [Phycisphaerae bacterium]